MNWQDKFSGVEDTAYPNLKIVSLLYKKGLYDVLYGKVVIRCAYDKITYFDINHWFVSNKKKNLGPYNSGLYYVDNGRGRLVVPVAYKDISITGYDKLFWVKKKFWTLYNKGLPLYNDGIISREYVSIRQGLDNLWWVADNVYCGLLNIITNDFVVPLRKIKSVREIDTDLRKIDNILAGELDGRIFYLDADTLLPATEASL